MEIIAAVATDDGVSTIKRHFGDAKQYSIFKINSKDAVYIKTIRNTTDVEDETHADPRKAGSVAALLRNENVNTVISKAFGPNIKRIKRKFVCVLADTDGVDNAVKKAQQKIVDIENEWEKGEERNYLRIK